MQAQRRHNSERRGDDELLYFRGHAEYATLPA